MINNNPFALTLCDRLRQLRKHVNLTIKDVAELTGLSFNQIQLLECHIVGNEYQTVVKKTGANGTVSTILILLKFYSKVISLDMLFDLTVPVADIQPAKATDTGIARTKLNKLIEDLEDVANGLQ